MKSAAPPVHHSVLMTHPRDVTQCFRVFFVSLFVILERGDLAEVRGRPAEADSADTQGLSSHRSTEGGTGVPQ